jgi:hypothetical protein
MIYAGFDVASQTGCAIFDGDRPLHIETWRPRKPRPEALKAQEIDIEHESALGEEFRNHFAPLIASFRPDVVGYETPRTRDFERRKAVHDPLLIAGQAVAEAFTMQRASSNLAMVRSLIFCAHLIGVCSRRNIPTYSIAPDTWRKSLLTYSRAPRGTKDGRAFLKKAVIKQLGLLGIHVPNDDAGDACGVAFHLRGMMSRGGALRPDDLFAQQGAVA